MYVKNYTILLPILIVGTIIWIVGCNQISHPPDNTVTSKTSSTINPILAFHEAIVKGDLTAIQKHIDEGTDVNEKLNGRAPLHIATLRGHKKIAEFLIAQGANVNIRDHDGRTPLHYASAQHNMELAQLLIAHGANVNAKDKQGLTILEAAGYQKSSDKEVKIVPGMVVCIDPETTGALVLSRKPYDRTVAGIIGGAGDISIGMRLGGQTTTNAKDEYPLSLIGRVFCWVDATNETIEPGDFLTTSATPGHAMKVTDFERARGAIIGKAMSSLHKGKGLVLVFISLQ